MVGEEFINHLEDIKQKKGKYMSSLPNSTVVNLAGSKSEHEKAENDNSSKITTEQALQLAQALSLNTRITTLDLQYNFIKDDVVIALVGINSLIDLNLGSNLIGDTSAIQLAKMHNLKKLNLSNESSFKYNTKMANHIGNAGAIALAKNKTLIDLDLRFNQVGNEGAIELAKNKILKKLQLHGNELIEIEGILALATNITLLNSEKFYYDGKYGRKTSFFPTSDQAYFIFNFERYAKKSVGDCLANFLSLLFLSGCFSLRWIMGSALPWKLITQISDFSLGNVLGNFVDVLMLSGIGYYAFQQVNLSLKNSAQTERSFGLQISAPQIECYEIANRLIPSSVVPSFTQHLKL